MNRAGAWMGIFILVFSGTCFYQSLSYGYYGKYGPGPGLLPLWVFGALMLFSLCLIIDSFRNEVISIKDTFPKGKGLKNVISVLLAVFLFIIATPYAGYNIASVLMFVILFAPAYKWYSNLCISVFATGIIFFIFNTLLKVPLPVTSMGF
ncbi:MAG: tripartite tricarboxylate transporter TctB family protein [Methylococcaceae bacterium]|jgi:hypothetical protein|nr:tripartite tricarboxylate transporter TctB family protein [Methylococcaceae bacterium]